MASRQRTQPESRKRVPKVRIARPSGRPFQLRYTCPNENREVRIGIGTRDEAEAERLKRELEAKLLLGIDSKPRQKARGPSMLWVEFRDEYSRLRVNTLRSEAAMESAEVRLDVCQAIMRPRTLADMADPQALARLQSELRAGSHSKRGNPRSPMTVKSYVRALQAALNWAHKMKWLPERTTVEVLVDDDAEDLKGRPLTDAEFRAMLEACPVGIGSELAADVESWRFLLRGLWESGLRLGEAMNLSWDDAGRITPLRTKGGGYLLKIPAAMQKNRKSQAVPTTPQFAALLDEVDNEQRTGWVFNPTARRRRGDGNGGQRRMTPKHVGRVITAIGKAAGVVVSESGKAASAHDLRRSFGQRMADAGLPPRDLQAIMRHASLATTERFYLRFRAVEQAERIALYLGTAERQAIEPEKAESPQAIGE